MDQPKELQTSYSIRKHLHQGVSYTSFNTLRMNEWLVKLSIAGEETIMVILIHPASNNIQMAYFNDEIRAHDFILGVTNT